MSSGAPQLTRQDLHDVAIYQKVIIWSILAEFIVIIGQIVVIIGQFVISPEAQILLGLVHFAIGVLATVFVFMLALKVYSVAMGIVLGILTLIPCIGLITLLIINQKATGLLNKYGYRVGLMGANLSQFKSQGYAEPGTAADNGG
jgi:hypothetical protein